MCPAPELREVPVRARDGERGHVGGEPVSAGPQAPQLRHGAAGVGGREARQEVPLQPRHQRVAAPGARHAPQH